MNEIIFWIVTMLAWLMTTLFFHELGHWLTAKSFKLPAKFGFNKNSLFIHVPEGTKEQHSAISLGGVIFGFIPTVIFGVWLGTFVGIMFCIAYVLGTWREIWGLIKDVK